MTDDSQKIQRASGRRARVAAAGGGRQRKAAALNRYGAARGEDGRISRSTGRDVQFATIVTPELKDWIKTEAKRRGKRMCVLLEDMRAAYEKVHGKKAR